MAKCKVTDNGSKFRVELPDGRSINFRQPSVVKFDKISTEYNRAIDAAKDQKDSGSVVLAMVRMMEAQVSDWKGFATDDPDLLVEFGLGAIDYQGEPIEVPYYRGRLEPMLDSRYVGDVFSLFLDTIAPSASGNSGSPAPSAQASSAGTAPRGSAEVLPAASSSSSTPSTSASIAGAPAAIGVSAPVISSSANAPSA